MNLEDEQSLMFQMSSRNINTWAGQNDNSSLNISGITIRMHSESQESSNSYKARSNPKNRKLNLDIEASHWGKERSYE